MSEQKVQVEASCGGVSFLGLLTILFIGLKLGDVIDWSWWWVLGPMWIPFAILFGVLAVVLMAMWILGLRDYLRGRRLRNTVKKAMNKHLKIYKP